MKPAIVKPAHFALSLSPLSRRIHAGNFKTVTDGKTTWAESAGKKYDVTSNFFRLLFALAYMIPDSQKQGSFTFSNQDKKRHYKVTIEEITQEELTQEELTQEAVSVSEQGLENRPADGGKN